jgi:diguanylate cyclase (GGDEF)-like protein
MADEVYAVVSQVARQLFPLQSGAVFVGGSRSSMECVTRWGQHAPQERSMAPDECWALRRGRVHLQGDPQHTLRCRHGDIETTEPFLSLCVPMLAQGEPFGVLHLVGPPGSDAAGQGPPNLRSLRALALTVAEHLSLGLANFKLREKLRAQSVRDPLTGLYNRRYLDECLEREVRRAARKHRSVGLILCDIDHFKQVNDRCGHEAGDAALKQLGRFLEAHVRGEDFICRYGGEEFILILPEASLRDTEQRAEAIRVGVREMRVDFPTEIPIRLTMSFGVAEAPALGTSPTQILRSADQALYEAKLAGRDRVVVGQPQGED